MTYRGCIKNGVAVLDTPAMLPDGTRVRIEIEPVESNFWVGQTVEELAREQGIQPVTNFAELAIDWPQEESMDDFQATVREARH